MFSAANNAGAALLIAFIGHGVADGDLDFYLMARDSPSGNPDSDTAFHLTQFVRERVKRFPSLDGVLFLVDACQTQEGVRGAATRWMDVLAANRGRMEVLVASGAGSAYDGCFTRTILSTFQSGLATRGDSLLCADLQPEISANCVARARTQLSGGPASPGSWTARLTTGRTIHRGGARHLRHHAHLRVPGQGLRAAGAGHPNGATGT